MSKYFFSLSYLYLTRIDIRNTKDPYKNNNIPFELEII